MAANDGAGQNGLKWVLAIVAGLPLLCGGCGLMGFFYMRSESPYDQAVERAANHRRVVEALGAPVEADFLFTGKLRSTGDDGVSALEIGLTGSKQEGTLYVKGVQTSGVWGFSTLRVKARDGTEINVLTR
jgi:hypothetical protein